MNQDLVYSSISNIKYLYLYIQHAALNILTSDKIDAEMILFRDVFLSDLYA